MHFKWGAAISSTSKSTVSGFLQKVFNRYVKCKIAEYFYLLSKLNLYQCRHKLSFIVSFTAITKKADKRISLIFIKNENA